ncbi:hypothetical protein F3Y22_tig00110718pilonHSYRG00024 [Hibiscus syriacus]|uniref:Uncharacterized protein n=1 Tax=Hibiscus syriacus TaxID=106335 RepID=A0A6A2ZUV1_HIBSY|nr:hypothetical protein F3Y22_tig00110718pilonHSYRG00024 [Hibiscus syriacus]
MDYIDIVEVAISEQCITCLVTLELKQTVGDTPWLAAGDFNVIYCLEESTEEEEVYLDRNLDAVLVSPSWMMDFPLAHVSFLAPGLSDHFPGLVRMDRILFSLLKPLRFFNFWAKDPDYLQVVSDSWNKLIQASNPMSRLFLKLKQLKPMLKELNSRNGHRGELVIREKVVAVELRSLESADESFFRQKSRVSWIQEGDCNYKFIHTMVAIRQNRQLIHTLTDDYGRVLDR